MMIVESIQQNTVKVGGTITLPGVFCQASESFLVLDSWTIMMFLPSMMWKQKMFGIMSFL